MDDAEHFDCNGPSNSKKLKFVEYNEEMMMEGKESSSSSSSSSTSPRKSDAAPILLHEFVFDYGAKGKAAVIYDNGKGRVETLSYGELDQGAEFVKKTLFASTNSGKCCDGNNNFVGVKCDIGRLYPILVLGILRTGGAFYNIDPEREEASVEDGVKYLGMEYLLSDVNWRGTGGKLVKLEEIQIGSEGIPFAFQVHKVCENFVTAKEVKIPKKNFAYAIQTSGTTGHKKTVLVPHSCICPNIADFSSRVWNVTPDDVIFASAPPTFDPHVVELFTALSRGATILYTNSQVKQNSCLLANLLCFHQVTILQITPSLFRRLSPSLIKRGTGNPSTKELLLRLITLGGEKCPEKEELVKLQSSLPNLTFQNVYGVTEVSCWASFQNIDLTSSSDPISIGNGLLDTEITLNPEGEIVIMSCTRHCIIIEPGVVGASKSPLLSQSGQKYKTGDLGRSTPSGIVFEGRMDRVVKRNGMKISLYQIEAITLSTDVVSYVECKMHHDGKIYLMVTLKSEYSISEEEEQKILATKLELPLFMYPDYIIALDESKIPLNGNGKVDFQSVHNSFHANLKRQQATTANKPILLGIKRQQIIETLIPIWKSCTFPGGGGGRGSQDDVLQENFVAAGGTSISATRFVESTFMALKLFGSAVHRKWEQSLLQCLLSVEGDLEGVVQLISSEITCNSSQMLSTHIASSWDSDMDMLPEIQDKLPSLSFSAPTLPQQFELNLMHSNIEKDDDSGGCIFAPVQELPLFLESAPFIITPPKVEQMFSFPLGLCVDASPAVIPSKSLVIIGCHGGILLCVDLNVLRRHPTKPDLAVIWKRRLPNRIEAKVKIHPNSLFAYVGCHNGHFYKLSVSTGEIMAWVCCREDAPIRSKCAITSDDAAVIFVDSANAIYCVDAQMLNVNWTIRSFKLLATVCPVTWRGRCYLSTLDKGIVCLSISTGATLWTTCDCNNETNNGLIYSTPVLSFHKAKRKGSNLPRLICGFNQGVELRDPKSGILQWRHVIGYSNAHTPPLLLNNCCDNLILIEGERATHDDVKCLGRILQVDTGSTLQIFPLPHPAAEIRTPSIVCYQSVRQQGSESVEGSARNQTCFLLYKNSYARNAQHGKQMCPQLIFVCLHADNMTRDNLIEGEVGESSWHAVAMENTPDFESFSKPVMCGEFILFGGRDNNLHVIQLQV